MSISMLHKLWAVGFVTSLTLLVAMALLPISFELKVEKISLQQEGVSPGNKFLRTTSNDFRVQSLPGEQPHRTEG